MSDEQMNGETQQTPTGHTIPVPKRDDVLRALEKAAKPGKAEQPRSARRRRRRPKE